MERVRKRMDGSQGDVVAQAIAYMRRNLQRPILVEEIAEQVGLTPKYLSSIFKRVTGKTLIAYLTELRIGCAKELLQGGGRRVSEVAVQVGYADRHYFNRVFSRYVGVPPGQYGSRAQRHG